MTNNRSTKRALFASVLALILCFSMLIGSTFAWFTDSVSSDKNTIVAGNLDIELKYSKVVNGVRTGWELVEGEDEIFDPNALWEPGRVEVVYLEVSNLGTLALKYQLGVAFSNDVPATNVAGETFYLSNHLVFKVVEMDDALATYDTYAAAVAAAGAEKGLKDYNGVTKALDPKDGANDKDYVALIVYMPKEVGNEANYRGTAPSIDLGIKLYATQYNAETDSFGPDYDGDAWADGFKVTNAQDLQSAIDNGEKNIVIEKDLVLDGPITIPAAAASASLMRAVPNATVINLNGCKITGTSATQSMIVNYGNLVIVGDEDSVVSLANVADAKSAVENYGNLTLKGGTYLGSSTANGLYVITNRGGTLTIEDGTVIKGIKGVAVNAGSAIINGGNIVAGATGKTTHAILASTGATSLVINGGTFENVLGQSAGGAVISDWTSVVGAVVVNGGTFKGGMILNDYGYGGRMQVYGGTFSSKLNNKYLAAEHSMVKSGDAYIALPEASLETIADGLYFDKEATYYLTNANGLIKIAEIVNSAVAYEEFPFKGETILLMNDIDLGGMEWIPIGDNLFQRTQFFGTFDGQGNTIKNFKITKKTDIEDKNNQSSYGLFGNLNGTVKNLTVDGASISGAPKFIGALVGRMNGGLIENCHVVNSSVACNNWTIGALVGQLNDGKITGCSVKNTTVTAYGGAGGIVGVALGSGERTIENCRVENCTFVQNGSFGATYDAMFGAIVGSLYSGSLTVNVNGCTAEGNTVKGAASNALYGYVSKGDALTIDGLKHVGVSSVNETANAVDFDNDIVALLPAGNTNASMIDLALTGASDKNFSIIAQNTVFNGNLQISSHVNFKLGENATLIIDGITVNGTLKVVAYYKNIVIRNVKAHSIEVNDGGNVTIENCVLDGASGNGIYVVATAEGYNLTLKNNVIKNSAKNAVQISGCATGATYGAGSFVVEGNTFENWCQANDKPRAAFKVWGDSVLAPESISSESQLTAAAVALVEAIRGGSNTFNSSAENQVSFDFYDCVFN